MLKIYKIFLKITETKNTSQPYLKTNKCFDLNFNCKCKSFLMYKIHIYIKKQKQYHTSSYTYVYPS